MYFFFFLPPPLFTPARREDKEKKCFSSTSFFFFFLAKSSKLTEETLLRQLLPETLCDCFISPSLFFPTLCAVVRAAGGLFCCIKHFVGGQLYIMRGKSALFWLVTVKIVRKRVDAPNLVERTKMKSGRNNVFKREMKSPVTVYGLFYLELSSSLISCVFFRQPSTPIFTLGGFALTLISTKESRSDQIRFSFLLPDQLVYRINSFLYFLYQKLCIMPGINSLGLVTVRRQRLALLPLSARRSKFSGNYVEIEF